MRTHPVPVFAATAIAATSLVLTTQVPVAASTSLSSRLLTVQQLPLGWTVNNTPPKDERNQGFGIGFLSSFIKAGAGGATGAVGAVFDDAGNPPELTERVEVNTNAAKLLSVLVNEFTSHPRLGSGDSKATFSVMSFPHVGQGSAAFRMKIETSAVGGGTATIGGYFFVEWQGEFLAALTETGRASPPSVTQFLSFMHKASQKL